MNQDEKQAAGLGLLCILLGIWYAASVLTAGRQHSNIRQGALLNPKYRESIVSVAAAEGGQAVSVQREGSIWVGTLLSETGGRICFPSDKINALLDTLVSVRSIYTVSDSGVSASAYGVDSDKGFHLSAVTQENGTAASLYFGGKNHTGRRIFVRTEQNSGIYEIENDIFPWLSVSARQWADMAFIPQSATGALNENQIQHIVIKDAFGNKRAAEQDELADAARTLLSLRGSGIESKKKSEEDGSYECSVGLDIGDGSAVKLDIYRSTADDSLYYVIPAIIPGPAWDESRRRAVADFEYCLTASAWSYNRVMELAGTENRR